MAASAHAPRHPRAPLTPQGRVGLSAEPPRGRGLGFVSGQKGQGERRFPGCREDEASEGAASAGPAPGAEFGPAEPRGPSTASPVTAGGGFTLCCVSLASSEVYTVGMC